MSSGKPSIMADMPHAPPNSRLPGGAVGDHSERSGMDLSFGLEVGGRSGCSIVAEAISARIESGEKRSSMAQRSVAIVADIYVFRVLNARARVCTFLF
jgi:hypothetical protein